jgi:hypothetical protein
MFFEFLASWYFLYFSELTFFIFWRVNVFWVSGELIFFDILASWFFYIVDMGLLSRNVCFCNFAVSFLKLYVSDCGRGRCGSVDSEKINENQEIPGPHLGSATFFLIGGLSFYLMQSTHVWRRVTRLGEFSRTYWAIIYTLWALFKIYRNR